MHSERLRNLVLGLALGVTLLDLLQLASVYMCDESPADVLDLRDDLSVIRIDALPDSAKVVNLASASIDHCRCAWSIFLLNLIAP